MINYHCNALLKLSSLWCITISLWAVSDLIQQAGVTGFCMGGALSIASSVLVPEVDAVVAFYGAPSSELADPAQAKAPVQAHFGELDNFVGFSDVTVWNCYLLS